MIRLNLPVAVFTIIARRLIDHCRKINLIPLIFAQNNQLAMGYSGSQPSLLLGITLGIIYVYRRYRNLSRCKVERKSSLSSNYSPKRLSTQRDMKVSVRRPWYVKKSDPISNHNKHETNRPGTGSRSIRRFTLPTLQKKEFMKPVAEDVDSASIISNRKPNMRTSHQSTMISDSLLTINESMQYAATSNYLTKKNSCLDFQRAHEESRHLQPEVNLRQNCIDLISNDGDVCMRPMRNSSNNSINSSLLGVTPKMLMSENIMNQFESKYKDNNLSELPREIVYSKIRPDDDDDDDVSKLSQVSPITSEMTVETYTKRPKKKRRGKLRFTTKKKRRNIPRKNSSTTFALNRTRSGRIYNTGSMVTSTTCKKRQQPKTH